MALESGYYYIKLDDITFTTNPSIYKGFRANKPIARSLNLTGTITQQWAIQSSDKDAHIEWNNLDKTQLDLLITKYDAATTYTFIDIYNNSYTVGISNLDWTRRRFLDSQGFRVILDLVRTT